MGKTAEDLERELKIRISNTITTGRHAAPIMIAQEIIDNLGLEVMVTGSWATTRGDSGISHYKYAGREEQA